MDEELEVAPDMSITELDDGSALVEPIEAEEAAQDDFYANLVGTLSKFERNQLASDLLELIEKDKESRKKRDEQYEEGIRRTGLGDDAPGGAMFDGASRVVHPVLAEGCVDFAARAIKELFPPSGPVKTKIYGDADIPKLQKSRRKSEYLNWLLTKKMRSYRDEKEILLTQLPLGGSQYEKFYPDRKRGCYVMEFVPVDKVLLPFAATSFYSTPRLTHMLDLTRAEFESRVDSGFYEYGGDLNTDETPEETASEQANDKVEGREADNYNEDGLRRVYEVTCDRDIDGEVAPYVIHIDEPSGEVVAIYRNWDENDEHKERLHWWVEDKFIPWRGAYGIGLPHLIGSLAGALTGALRALLDSAHINNSPGAVKLKGGRASGQNITIEQTQVVELEAPPGTDDIRKVMMPLPFNPPSPVLFQLLDWITNQAKGVVATAEDKLSQVGDRTPVGTTMAIVEQGSATYSAIHARLHESQRRALEIICRLVRQYPDEDDLARFGLTPEDFAEDDDIEPVSDPRIFSEAQRFAQLQEEIKLIQVFPQLPWKMDEVARRGLELLRVDGIDSILPPTPQPVTADPVTENFMAITARTPLKATPEQDHVAHLRAHLTFLIDPLYGAGPAIPGSQSQVILAHAQEHLMQVYIGAAKAAAAVRAAQTGEATELTMAEGSEFAMQQVNQQLGNLVQMLQQAAQTVQQKMPQPPVDPAVQKTFEAAMAEIERKKAVDAENIRLKEAEMNNSAMLEQQQQAIDERLAEMGNVFKLQIAQLQEDGRRAAEELRQQVELMKNDRDNEQHQMTEIIKNYQDNLTQMQVALQKVSEDVQKVGSERPDFTPQVEQLNKVLASVEGAKTSDALTAVVEGLRETIGHLSRPKMIVTDEQGRPVGIQ